MKFCNVSLFVTLTYRDEELIYADDEPIVYKRHLQLHFKMLRKALDPGKIKYYAVGEYGDHSRPLTPLGRPHFHYILFYYGDLDRFRLMNLIKSKWQYGDETRVYEVSGAQGYVTKYILKFDTRDHKVSACSMISHGIGLGYLSDKMVKYHKDNLISYAIKPGGYKVNLPRYYKDRIFKSYQKLLMKKRADLYRRELEIIKFDNVRFAEIVGLHSFRNDVLNYELRLYNSVKFYKTKKKL